MSHPFDDDVWELYHVAEDFSEVVDLAAAEPEQLQKMKDLWWEEAAKYQVLPLNNEPLRHRDGRHRRRRFAYRPGIGPIPEFMAPNLKSRGFVIAAELAVPAAGDVSGVIAAHGSHSGGYAAYLKDRRLHFVYNFVGTTITTVSAGVELPGGAVEIRVVAAKGEIGTTDITLWYGDVPVGEGVIPRRTPLTYGTTAFAVGYQPSGPIAPALEGRAEITADVLRQVVIEVEGKPKRATGAEVRKDLSTQ